jgi:hypothetical protein
MIIDDFFVVLRGFHCFYLRSSAFIRGCLPACIRAIRVIRCWENMVCRADPTIAGVVLGLRD